MKKKKKRNICRPEASETKKSTSPGRPEAPETLKKKEYKPRQMKKKNKEKKIEREKKKGRVNIRVTKVPHGKDLSWIKGI